MYDNFEPMNHGFVNTLKVFRDVLPKRCKYNLESLAWDSGVNTTGALNALVDVKMLCSLLVTHRTLESKLLECKQTLAEYTKIVCAEKDLVAVASIFCKDTKKQFIALV